LIFICNIYFNFYIFSKADFSGGLGFLKNYDADKYEFTVDECCYDSFRKNVTLRKKVDL
jgi:hypothetical protein